MDCLKATLACSVLTAGGAIPILIGAPGILIGILGVTGVLGSTPVAVATFALGIFNPILFVFGTLGVIGAISTPVLSGLLLGSSVLYFMIVSALSCCGSCFGIMLSRVTS